VPVFPRMREHSFALSSVELSPQAIASYDVVLLATAHSAFDYELVRQYANLIVDTRGVFLERLPNVVKA
jgi:UDP-N-acetyl-D-glucosamine dehydrogenase